MRIPRTLKVVVLLLLALLVAGVAPGLAAGKRKLRTAAPIVLRRHFDQIASGVQQLQLAGPDLLLVNGFTAGGTTQGATLIDDRTGQRTELSQPRCATPVSGGQWLAFNAAIGTPPPADCETQLYPLAGGAPRPLNRNMNGNVVAIGSDWIEFVSTCDQVHPCPSYSFQNLQTGVVRSDPTDATTIANLNSPTLAQRVCSPLRVPITDSLVAPTSWLVFDGRFAIASGANGIFLDHCGTRLHRALEPPYGAAGATTNAVIWQSGVRRLTGLFLPSLRTFTLQAPEVAEYQLALTTRTLYLLAPEGKVWATAAPKP